jgi:hypothetical protein
VGLIREHGERRRDHQGGRKEGNVEKEEKEE